MQPMPAKVLRNPLRDSSEGIPCDSHGLNSFEHTACVIATSEMCVGVLDMRHWGRGSEDPAPLRNTLRNSSEVIPCDSHGRDTLERVAYDSRTSAGDVCVLAAAVSCFIK